MKVIYTGCFVRKNGEKQLDFNSIKINKTFVEPSLQIEIILKILKSFLLALLK